MIKPIDAMAWFAIMVGGDVGDTDSGMVATSAYTTSHIITNEDMYNINELIDRVFFNNNIN